MEEEEDDDDDGSHDDEGEDANYRATSSKGPFQSQHSLRKLDHDASSSDGLETQRKSSKMEHQRRPSSHRQHRSHHSMNLDGLNLTNDGRSNVTK